jgi:hypothetical protein
VRLARGEVEDVGAPAEGEGVGALVDGDDDRVAHPHPQTLDPRLEVRLILLGDVVVGVLLEVAELARSLDPLGHLRPRGTLEALDLCAKLVEPLGRDGLAGEFLFLL